MEAFAWIWVQLKKLNIIEMQSLTMQMVPTELGYGFVMIIANVAEMFIGPDVCFTTISEMVQC